MYGYIKKIERFIDIIQVGDWIEVSQQYRVNRSPYPALKVLNFLKQQDSANEQRVVKCLTTKENI